MKRITVLLAEDHKMVREGLLALLAAEADIEVVGDAQDGRQAVAIAKKLSPAVVVLDIVMPLLNGLQATRQILKSAPATKVLFLSAHSDDAYIEQAMEAGAAGYVLKQSSSCNLVQAIREVQKGNTYFCPILARRFARINRQSHRYIGNRNKKSVQLTTRELEVLQLIAEGMANKQIASELGICIKTVEKHRQSLMQKLNIHETAGLTRYAINVGIIESNVQVTIV